MCCEQCRNCDCLKDKEFDAKLAFENLARKHEELAEIVAQYMAEASLKRSTRAKRALELSEAITTRVIGGATVPAGGHPECCLVGQVSLGGVFSWYCTGVLIHPRVVLTAAHCQKPQENRIPNVVALNTNSHRPAEIAGANVIRLVQPPVIHPFYRSATKIHDIAALILREPAMVSPVARASHSETINAASAMIVGFGNTSPAAATSFGTKRFVDVPIRLIRRRPDEDFTTTEFSFGFESDLEFVAGGDGVDACVGDSGGPAYINAGGVKKVAGLVSRKVRNATSECGSGGIYTRLDSQADFINDVIRMNNL